jgi:serine protease AprX
MDCALCHRPTAARLLAEVDWVSPALLQRLAEQHPGWQRADGACPACVQQALLQLQLEQGDAALYQAIQTVWPLDAEAAFGALPTPLRLHADPRYNGQGVTIAIVDTGFYPHPDLTQPVNRIRVWVDATQEPVQVRTFEPNELPVWPGWDAGHSGQWHGLMTSTVAAGNGRLSHGLYRGLASEADLVLIQIRTETTPIDDERIVRALSWLKAHGPELGVRVVNLSFGGDPVWPLAGNPVDAAVADLVQQNISVVAAAGNDGLRQLLPPATAPEALTIGGLDDHNTFDHHQLEVWHSNYGQGWGNLPKPELVAPSIWVVAPLLPGSEVAAEAAWLFANRTQGEPAIEGRLNQLKLVTPHYQHVDGTSFAAPLTSSVIATMLQANPNLTPALIRNSLISSAQPVPGAPAERQGAGALAAGPAVALALREQHGPLAGYLLSPQVKPGGITFLLHDHLARQVEIRGSWNGWAGPGLAAAPVEAGIWQARLAALPPGDYTYKFLLDGRRWLDDPTNPHKVPDGLGGFNTMLTVPAI